MIVEKDCTKLIFVDVDGVLSAPRFGKYEVGMSEEEWLIYCVKHGDSSYEDCSPVACVNSYLKEEQKDAGIYVLTAVESTFEAEAKRKFVEKKYSEIKFDGFIGVSKKANKIPIILAIAEENKFFSKECEIIEDDYELLIKCEQAGLRVKHLANIASKYR